MIFFHDREKTIDYKEELTFELDNPLISSMMIGNLQVDKNSQYDVHDVNGNLYAIATLDGVLMLAKTETILWY